MLRIVATRGQEVLGGLSVADIPGLLEDPAIRLWVDLSGGLDETARYLTAEVFRFHPLAIQDCFEERERPKIQAYDGYVYVITHGLTCGSTAEDTEVVEMDAFFGQNYLVTYHSKESRSVEGCWEAVVRSGEPLRRGPVCLFQALLDRQVDGIEPILDGIEERLEGLEDRVLLHHRQADLVSLLALRRSIVTLRRWLGLQRDVVLRLARAEFAPVSPQEALLFRDTHDHLSRFTELLETFRELTMSLQEAHLSAANNRLGEIMKVLTAFTAVLMPLTVLTGIYGMNFVSLPGLAHPCGFWVFSAVMLAVAAGTLWFVRRKGWVGRGLHDEDQLPEPAPASTEARPCPPKVR